MSLLSLEYIQNAFRGQLLLRVDYVSIYFRSNLREPHTPRESRCESLARALSVNRAICQIRLLKDFRNLNIASDVRTYDKGARERPSSGHVVRT
jgi:hypothetical protein